MSPRAKIKPQEEAKKLLEKFGISSVPIPVEKIVTYLEATLTFSPLDEELSGVVFIKDNNPVIGINSLHHSNRQRFTIAHEIGHLILHRKNITDHVHVDKQGAMLMRNSVSATGTNRIEIEANQFAAALLMPKEFIIEALRDADAYTDEDSLFDDIAQEFKVSRQALEHRISALLSEN